MRGKVCKALRRQARAETEGNPAVAYLSRQGRRERVVERTVEARAGEPGAFSRAVRGVRRWFKKVPQKIRITSEEIRLDPNSTKGRYRWLKKQWKAA